MKSKNLKKCFLLLLRFFIFFLFGSNAFASSDALSAMIEALRKVQNPNSRTEQEVAFNTLKTLSQKHIELYKNSAVTLRRYQAEFEREAGRSFGTPQRIYMELANDLAEASTRVESMVTVDLRTVHDSIYQQDAYLTSLAAEDLFTLVIQHYGARFSSSAIKGVVEGQLDLLNPIESCRFGIFCSSPYAAASFRNFLLVELSQLVQIVDVDILDTQLFQNLGEASIENPALIFWLVGHRDQDMLRVYTTEQSVGAAIMNGILQNKSCPVYFAKQHSMSVTFNSDSSSTWRLGQLGCPFTDEVWDGRDSQIFDILAQHYWEDIYLQKTKH